MNLSEVLDRSRELVRSRGLEPAIAAVQAVDELTPLEIAVGNALAVQAAGLEPG